MSLRVKKNFNCNICRLKDKLTFSKGFIISNHVTFCEVTFKKSQQSMEEEKGMTEGEIVGWHHQLYGHEFE